MPQHNSFIMKNIICILIDNPARQFAKQNTIACLVFPQAVCAVFNNNDYLKI